MSRPPLPPFTLETAIQKVRLAEDAWNSRDPARVALAYSPDSRWRNRAEFLQGRAEIEAFLTQKWQPRTRLPAHQGTVGVSRGPHRRALRLRVARRRGQWFRSYGNENWEFDAEGLMHTRIASINDLPIAEASASSTGRRPAAGRPSRLTELGL